MTQLPDDPALWPVSQQSAVGSPPQAGWAPPLPAGPGYPPPGWGAAPGVAAGPPPGFGFAPAPGGGSPAVVLNYQLTRTEYVRTSRWRLLRTRRLVISMAAVVLGLGVLFPIALLVPMHATRCNCTRSSPVGAVIAVLACVVFVPLVLFMSPSTTWKRGTKVKAPRSLAFSDAGVWHATPTSQNFTTWDSYASVLEAPLCYLVMLRFGKRTLTAHTVPKRAFRNPGDEAAFRAIAGRHVATRFRDSPNGPPTRR